MFTWFSTLRAIASGWTKYFDGFLQLGSLSGVKNRRFLSFELFSTPSYSLCLDFLSNLFREGSSRETRHGPDGNQVQCRLDKLLRHGLRLLFADVLHARHQLCRHVLCFSIFCTTMKVK